MNDRSLIKPLIVVIAVALVVGGLVNIDNPLRTVALDRLKAGGYIQYEPMEAYTLARKICTQCHSEERIKLYCPRCGPPFVAVIPHMQTFIQNYRTSRPDLEFHGVTEAQAVAIVQVWNAIVGNWEQDFRPQDIKKMIGGYPGLYALYQTPVDERPIESRLRHSEKLHMGYISKAKDLQKNLGASSPGAPETPSGAGAKK